MSRSEEKNAFCKGCTVSVQISPDEIDNLLDKTINVRKIKVVPKKLYREKLQCCLIHIKAKLLNVHIYLIRNGEKI